MQIPPVITFRRTPQAEPLETYVRKRLAKLEIYCPSIIGARVLIQPEEARHRDGHRFRVRIQLTVPGEEIVVAHKPSVRASARTRALPSLRKRDEPDRSHRHANVAIREAFEVARRQLQDYERRRRGQVKTHAAS